MLRTQVSLDPRKYRAARVEARRLGISLAEYVRRALDAELARGPSADADRPWMRFAGSLEGGVDDSDADSIDAVVYGRAR